MDKRIRDKVIECSARIKDLRHKLQLAENELDELLSADPQATVPQKSRGSSTIAEQIQAFIDGVPDNTFTTASVVHEFHDVPAPTVRTMLARLCKEKAIEHVGRGLYRSLAASHGTSQSLFSKHEVAAE